MDAHPSAESINRAFYDRVYGASSLLAVLLRHYVSYDQLSKTRRNLRLARLVPEYVKPLSILDYGFGHGTFLFRLPRRHRLSGVELSDAAIRNATKLAGLLGRKPALLSPDEFQTVSADLVFDIIACSHVLEHVRDDIGLLRHFHARLRTDGHLLLNLPINEVWNDPNHVRRYSAETAAAAVEANGFRVAEVVQADRLSGWLLSCELRASASARTALRVLRLVLALLPVNVLDALESVVLERHEPQQLLILARKL